MKKTFVIIAILFVCLSAKAQVNHIISTLFEPDSCFVLDGIINYEIDMNQDGIGDIVICTRLHSPGSYYSGFITKENWQWSISYDNHATIWDPTIPISDTTMIADTLEWEDNDYCNLNVIPDHYIYAFRHQAEDGVHYGWAYIYLGAYMKVCIRSMGYCTLPDTPIRWGQTELWGVEENGAEGFATLHPNPTTGMVTVKGENLRQAFVTNLLGQQVLSVQGEGDELQIDMTALPAGVYFVTVTDENGRKCVRKAVRE